MEPEIDLKIVVVGDGNVGKTSMLTSYCKDKFSLGYQPTGEITHSIGVLYFLLMGDWSISLYYIVWLNSYGMLIQKIRKMRLKRSIPLPSSQNKSNPPPSASGLDLFWLSGIGMDFSISHFLILWIYPISHLQKIQNSNGMVTLHVNCFLMFWYSGV